MFKVFYIVALLSFSATSAYASSYQTSGGKTIIQAIYCEEFGGWPERFDGGFDSKYNDIYGTHLRKFTREEIDLVGVISDIKALKKSQQGATYSTCEQKRTEKSMLQHYNDLKGLYCNVLGDKRSDWDNYFLKKLRMLFYAQTTLAKLEREFKAIKDVHTVRGEKCETYTPRTLEDASSESGASDKEAAPGELTLDFKYDTLEQVENPLNHWVANYADKKSKCDFTFDYFKNKAKFSDSVAAGIKSCVQSLSGEEKFKCFEVDIKTKNQERKCQALEAAEKAKCIANARDAGQKELLKLGCSGLSGQGNEHVIYQLTEASLDSHCSMDGSNPSVQYDNKLNQFYNMEDRGALHSKLALCLKQNCYNHQGEYLNKLLEKGRRNGAQACPNNNSDVSFHCYSIVQGGENKQICTGSVDLQASGVDKNHPIVKSVLTEERVNKAKRFGGLYVNNHRIAIGKTPKGEMLKGTFNFRLDTNGKFVSAGLSIFQEFAPHYRPKVDTKNMAVWKDFSKLELEWAGHVFADGAKDVYKCPYGPGSEFMTKARNSLAALNANLYFQAKLLGCITSEKVNAGAAECDSNKLSTIMTETQMAKNKIVWETQMSLTGNEDPSLAPKEGSIHYEYPACIEVIPDGKAVLTAEVEEASEEDKAKLNQMTSNMLELYKLAKDADYNETKIREGLDKLYLTYFGLGDDTWTNYRRVSFGIFARNIKSEAKEYYQSGDASIESSNSSYANKFYHNLSLLDEFSKELKEAYCSILGVEIDRSDKHFMQKFLEVSNDLFFNGKPNYLDKLLKYKEHFRKEKGLYQNSKDKPYMKNRKACK